MANVKVSFSVQPKTQVEELYIVGSTSSLGNWDAAKATKLTYCNECQKFVVSKMLPAGEVVEFKFISSTDWNNVEKGTWKEDIANRTIVPEKGLNVELTIENF